MLLFQEKLKLKLKPKKHKHFSWGSKRGNALQTQLRVGRSFLNAHSFTINLADSDLCLCSRSETTTHYLTQCFLYTEERRLLYNSLEQLLPKFKTFTNKKQTEILLNGINLIFLIFVVIPPLQPYPLDSCFHLLQTNLHPYKRDFYFFNLNIHLLIHLIFTFNQIGLGL